ncbi:hypothetical protein [Glutamicibacter sp. NPDC087344]|uniref:hypothetical protein n=1 Tax=Glutamicibacter sp. NPDC087344 TaxID=3363994 RepID=UPI0037F41A61
MPFVEAFVPSIALGLLFWYVMKGLTNADRKERQAEAEADALIQNRTDSDTRPASE